MAMTKTEARYLDCVLQFLTGQPVPVEDAYWCAAQLADRARVVLPGMVGPGTVQDYGQDHEPRLLPGDRLAPEVAELLAGWWTLEAEGGGQINGGDAVTFVEQWFTETCGANTTHPVVRAQNGPDGYVPTEGMDEWDEVRDLRPFAAEHGRDQYVPTVCDRCGGPIRDPEHAPVEMAICVGCASSEAEEAGR